MKLIPAVVAIALALGACTGPSRLSPHTASPLTIGESLTLNSSILGETRRLNVFVPTVYGERIDAPMPVLYMPDGGINEDFLHIAGLIQILVSSGSMRPFMLVGIENTQRRRDLTGPTTIADDLKIAPVVGGSAKYRRFLAEEVIPEIRRRYRTTSERAIVGESLAGLFVMETFFTEPELFDAYIAIDPSLWWAGHELVSRAPERLGAGNFRGRSLFLSSSNEPTIAQLTLDLAGTLDTTRPEGLQFFFAPMPGESHATIFHPAALTAFRSVLAPRPADDREGAKP